MMARSRISKLQRYNKLLNEGFILQTGTVKKESNQDEPLCHHKKLCLTYDI